MGETIGPLGAAQTFGYDGLKVAVIKAPQFRGRPIDDCVALAKTRGLHATLDEDFAKDLEDIISSHREPLNPPAWD